MLARRVIGVPIIPLLFFAIAGVVALVLGLRGRRIDDHPICRKCRFDLVGVWPGGERCPECGAGLETATAVEIGNSVRDAKLLWIGAVVVALTGLVGGTAAYMSARGIPIVQFLPERLLVSGAIRTNIDPFEHLAEIERRIAAGRLSMEARRKLVAAALLKQADDTYGWYGAWGNVVQLEWERGVVSDEVFKRFMMKSVRLKYVVELDPHWDLRHSGAPSVVMQLDLDSRASQLPRMPGLMIRISSVKFDGEERLVLNDFRTGLPTSSYSNPYVRLLPGNGGGGGTPHLHYVHWDSDSWPARAEATLDFVIWYSPAGDGPDAKDAINVEWTEVVPVRLPERVSSK